MTLFSHRCKKYSKIVYKIIIKLSAHIILTNKHGMEDS